MQSPRAVPMGNCRFEHPIAWSRNPASEGQTGAEGTGRDKRRNQMFDDKILPTTPSWLKVVMVRLRPNAMRSMEA